MKKSCFLFGLVLFSFFGAFATHIKGGQVTITRNGASGLSYIIALRGFTHITTVRPGGGKLDLGDGSQPIVTPAQPVLTTTDGITWFYDFIVEHTYPGPCTGRRKQNRSIASPGRRLFCHRQWINVL